MARLAKPRSAKRVIQIGWRGAVTRSRSRSSSCRRQFAGFRCAVTVFHHRDQRGPLVERDHATGTSVLRVNLANSVPVSATAESVATSGDKFKPVRSRTHSTESSSLLNRSVSTCLMACLGRQTTGLRKTAVRCARRPLWQK